MGNRVLSRRHVGQAMAAAFASVSLLAFSACNTPLEDYVAETVKLEATRSTTTGETLLRGSLDFERKYTVTRYHQVCDSYVCGYDSHEACYNVPRCRTVDGQEVCEGSHRECESVSEPRYCETNCRNEPYTEVETETTTSPVVAKIVGADAANVETLWLGVETNGKFEQAIKNVSQLPSDDRALFENLREGHQNLLMLEGKGIKLSADQDFLKLADDFRPGQLIELEVNVTSSGSGTQKSAAGTSKKLPNLVEWVN